MVSTTSCCVVVFCLSFTPLSVCCVMLCCGGLMPSASPFFSCSLFSAQYYGDFCLFSRRCWSSKPQNWRYSCQ
ncbi:hypothetical protein BD769DRAFT_902874 [Suillus cothurnatus]|nr:hypothetical protein BD769DRAFT_902874 [Suillus cothurnatus]